MHTAQAKVVTLVCKAAGTRAEVARNARKARLMSPTKTFMTTATQRRIGRLRTASFIACPLRLFPPLIGGGIGIVPPSVTHVNQEIPTRYQALRRFQCAVRRIPATCYPARLGRYSIPRTIWGGDGGGAAFARSGGTRELPLLAGSSPTDHRTCTGNDDAITTCLASDKLHRDQRFRQTKPVPPDGL